MNATITKKDRFLGCFLGGAVGDALGYPVEFVDETYIRKKYGPQGIQTLAQAGEGKGPAAITDDTQMTLFVINGLLYAKTSHQAPNGTCSALQNHVSDREAVWLAHQEWLGTQGDTSRMKDTKNPKMWLYRESRLHALRAPGGTCLSAQTHGHPLGYMSASALAVMLAAMVHYRPGEYKTLQDAILRSFTDSHSACAEIHDGLKKAVSLALDPSVSDLDGIHSLG
ncbi:MAG: ADP-ribosylglycohydrolase family protein, partial [Lachnospiraceae bacterium]|nr:ADP-ribosylglycohydrolase family protein [Lachnospiraceae bacterium]